MARARRQTERKMRRFEVIQLWVDRLVVWLMLVVVFVPILSIVTASLQTGDVFFSESLLPDPSRFTLDNYTKLFTATKFPLWIRNTVFMGVAVGTLQVAITATSAFAFSRLRFWGRKYGIQMLLLLQMMPNFVMLAAIQYMLFKLDIANLFGLMFVFVGASAYNIWLVKGYMDGLPKELDEAARVDGATDWQVFAKVILPLSRPMLAVMFLFAFMGIYSEFTMSSAILRDPSEAMLAQGLRTFIRDQFATRWGQFAAAVLVASVPLATIWAFAQRYVEAGLTRGAIKG
ncbi:MAG TPA: ABC transporter permease subunit [Symbiobacteriaceae bacterium]|nr:ABC transporter permease subunit [Symbiobacteriaceae bacterium]